MLDIDKENNNLDTSWIQTEEKIDSIENLYSREQCESIDIFYIYLDKDNAIEKIVSEKEMPQNGEISKERLLKMIQTKRMVNKKKYKLFDILSFQVDIEPTNIEAFNKNKEINEISEHCFKVLPLFDSISCISSIFIFQDINSIYFLFKEPEKFKELKSILKDGEKKNTCTKKVRISDSINEAITNIVKKSMKNKKNMKKFTKKNHTSM